MDTERRIYLIRLTEKIKANPKYSERLGIKCMLRFVAEENTAK